MSILNVIGIIGGVLFLFYIVAMLIIGRYLTYLDLFLPRECPDGSRELRGYEYEDIEFKSYDNLSLRGWFIKSESNPTGKTVFIIPGWTRNRTRYLSQIKFFVDSGFHVLTYDQRSHGASDTGVVTFGPKEGLDLLNVIEYAKNLECVNEEKLVAVGFSLGAISVIYAAEKQVFKAVVLEGVFANSYDMGEAILIDKVGERFAHLFGYAFFWPGAMIWTLGKFRHSQPVKHIAKVSPTPALIIRGENDERVPFSSAKKMLGAVKEPKEIWIHKAGHTTSYNNFPDEYEKRVLSFLNSYLQK